MPTYAVTGASGHLGRLVVQELLARGVPASDVVAVVRARGKAADLAGRGVQVREADYSRPETLGAALAAVERLLLVSSSEPARRAAHHANVIRAAKTAGTSRVVYTSMLNAGLPAGEYASWLQQTGVDEAAAHFIAALDASIARGDLQTSSQDLAQLLERPATPLADVVGAAYDAVPKAARDSRER
jgi:uncharacterized protein YbjT (DUF2867 family)